jgi:membrane protein
MKISDMWKSVKNKFKVYYSITKDAYINLQDNDPLRLGSSTAFYALFALPASLLLLLAILGFILNEEIISEEYFRTLEEAFGRDTAIRIFAILKNLGNIGDQWWLVAGSMIVFAISASTLFIVVKSSINQIWNLKPQTEKFLIRMVRRRAIALAFIFFGGILSLLSIITDAILGLISDFIPDIFPDLQVLMIQAINQGLAVLILTVWFAFLFKYLPDANIKWKIVWKGAILTSVLFTIGKYAMSLILFRGEISTVYGATSSIIVLLLFIYYASLLIYFGAAFTRSYANYRKIHILPNRYSIRYKIEEVKSEYLEEGD